jgi:hypothetical protein
MCNGVFIAVFSFLPCVKYFCDFYFCGSSLVFETVGGFFSLWVGIFFSAWGFLLEAYIAGARVFVFCSHVDLGRLPDGTKERPQKLRLV